MKIFYYRWVILLTRQMKFDEHGFPIYKISWTQLTRLETCVKQAKLYAAGKRQPISNTRNFLTGNIVDNAQRKWLELPNPAETSLVSLGKEMFDYWTEKQKDTIKWRGNKEDDKRQVLEDAEEALSILEPWLTDNILPYPYQPEARGTANLVIPDWNGVKHKVELFFAVDIAVQLEEGWWLMDLKTTKNEKYIYGQTLAQPTYYALAWSLYHKIPLTDIVKTSFITPLTKNIETVVSPTTEDYSVMLQRIQKYAWIFWNENYAPTKKEPDWQCRNFCEVRQSCPLMLTPVSDDGTIDFMAVANARKGL